MKHYLKKIVSFFQSQFLQSNAEVSRLQLVGTIESEFYRLKVRLARAKQDKKTLTRLLSETSDELEKSSEFVKQMFGRYLSMDVMNSLIEKPEGLNLGGERRNVTIMVSDIRGFTALSERLEPEKVVQILNLYFDVMVDIIFRYGGTISEIAGDSLLVIFGAPQAMPNRISQAVACAIEMQNAMEAVNKKNHTFNFPELEMGIGLNDASVVVGNIGSLKRSKYGVVGSGVNIASRIESYTVGRQIFVSESIYSEIGHILRIDSQHVVFPKGMEDALTIYEVGSISGTYNLIHERNNRKLLKLVKNIPFTYSILVGKDILEHDCKGEFVEMSKTYARVELECPTDTLVNIKLNLISINQQLSAKNIYGKVVACDQHGNEGLFLRFTSIPPEVDAYFYAYLQHT